MNDTIVNSNASTDDILAKVRAGIEHVEETGESFDIEMTEEEYSSYKNSLLAEQSKTAEPVIPTTEIKKDEPTTVIAAETAVVPTTNLLYTNKSVTTKLGEDTYEILVREFDLLKKIPKLGARYNALENILAAIKVSPTLYGITSGDVTKPNVGDVLNIEKIAVLLHDMTIAEKNIIDHANSLPDVVIHGIEEYMPADAKKSLEKIRPLQEPEKSSATIPIIEDPKGNHSLESGETAIKITDGKNETAIKQNTPKGLPVVSMTSEESVSVMESLVAEMKLHNIPWTKVLTVGAEQVIPFSATDHSDPMTQRIANLVKIHSIKADLPVKEHTTVLEYLQQTTLLFKRNK